MLSPSPKSYVIAVAAGLIALTDAASSSLATNGRLINPSLSEWRDAPIDARTSIALEWLTEWDSMMQRQGPETRASRAKTLVACVNRIAKPEAESELVNTGASTVAKDYASACVMMLDLW